jgi:hypothetical protein
VRGAARAVGPTVTGAYSAYGIVELSPGVGLDHCGVPSAESQIVMVRAPAEWSEAAVHDSVSVKRQSHMATGSIAVLQVTGSGLLS